MEYCCLCSCEASVKDSEKKLFCLEHYLTASRDGKLLPFSDKTINLKDVVDEELLLSESESIQALWKEAISSVALRMIELQKKEQSEKSRREGILPSNEELKELLRKDEKTITEISSSSSSADKKRRKLLKAGDSNDAVVVSNPFRRISSHPKTIWRTDLSTLTKVERDAELVEMKNKLEKERNGETIGGADEASATPCPNCKSLRTTTHLLGSYDIGKSETWGSKDATNAVMRIQCRECRYLGNATEGFSYLT